MLGRHSAFEAALRTQVDGVLAVNPAVTLYGFSRGEPLHTPDRRAASVPIRPISLLSHHHRKLAGALWRVYRQVALRHAPMRIPARIARRGTVVRILCGPYDARDFVEVLGTRPLLWWLRRRPGFSLEVDTTLDHSMLTRRVQEKVRVLATAFVRDMNGER